MLKLFSRQNEDNVGPSDDDIVADKKVLAKFRREDRQFRRWRRKEQHVYLDLSTYKLVGKLCISLLLCFAIYSCLALVMLWGSSLNITWERVCVIGLFWAILSVFSYGIASKLFYVGLSAWVVRHPVSMSKSRIKKLVSKYYKLGRFNEDDS